MSAAELANALLLPALIVASVGYLLWARARTCAMPRCTARREAGRFCTACGTDTPASLWR